MKLIAMICAVLALTIAAMAQVSAPVSVAPEVSDELAKVTSVKLLFDDSGLPTKFVLRFAFARTVTTQVGDGETEKTTTMISEVDLALHGGDRTFAATVIKGGRKTEVFCTDIILAQLIKARAELEFRERNPKAEPVSVLALTPPDFRRAARAPLESKSAPATNK